MKHISDNDIEEKIVKENPVPLTFCCQYLAEHTHLYLWMPSNCSPFGMV